jgi:hypothetical protein
MLLPWLQRPIEVANLFNPAFCALLVHQAVKAYELEAGRGMSYSTAFVVLPVVLHKDTRELLPHSIATKLHAWLQTNEQVRVGFAGRMQQINKAGALVVGPFKLGKLDLDKESETALCIKKAEFVGRWFASVPNPVALLALWGIKLQ